jgi:hypothetical protein
LSPLIVDLVRQISSRTAIFTLTDIGGASRQRSHGRAEPSVILQTHCVYLRGKAMG